MKREILKKIETKRCYVRDWSIEELGPKNILGDINQQLPVYIQFGTEDDILSWGSVTRTTMWVELYIELNNYKCMRMIIETDSLDIRDILPCI